MDQEVLKKLKEAVLGFDKEQSGALAREAVQAGIDPLRIMDALIEAVKEVGDAFGAGDLFLPELVGAADAMQAATPVIEEEIQKRGMKRKVLGKVVLGTVAGDIHTIGKSMVASLLTAEGFEVHDLGIDVIAEKFVEAIREDEADIVAMSSLLTTTAPQCKIVIDQLVAVGLREKVKVMVGGGAVTAAFAQAMGADGYQPTAPGAVKLAHQWMDK